MALVMGLLHPLAAQGLEFSELLGPLPFLCLNVNAIVCNDEANTFCIADFLTPSSSALHC